MTKPTNTDRIESARKILNAPASTIAELEAARAVLTHVLAETDAEVEEMQASAQDDRCLRRVDR